MALRDQREDDMRDLGAPSAFVGLPRGFYGVRDVRIAYAKDACESRNDVTINGGDGERHVSSDGVR
jgi:hypothetical protein